MDRNIASQPRVSIGNPGSAHGILVPVSDIVASPASLTDLALVYLEVDDILKLCLVSNLIRQGDAG